MFVYHVVVHVVFVDIVVEEEDGEEEDTFVQGGSNPRMSPDEAKKFVKNVKKMFAKTNTTRDEGLMNVALMSRKYGFLNACKDAAEWFVNALPRLVWSSATIATIYLFIRYAQRFATPAGILHRELDRFARVAEMINPGVRELAHTHSELTFPSAPRRFWQSFRGALRMATFGLSDVAIDGIEWSFHTISHLFHGDRTPTLSELSQLADEINVQMAEQTLLIDRIAGYNDMVNDLHLVPSEEDFIRQAFPQLGNN